MHLEIDPVMSVTCDTASQDALIQIRYLLDERGFGWDTETTVQWSKDAPSGSAATEVGPFRWCDVISRALFEVPDFADHLLILLGKEMPIIEERTVLHHIFVVAGAEAGRTNGASIPVRYRCPDEFLLALGALDTEVAIGPL